MAKILHVIDHLGLGGVQQGIINVIKDSPWHEHTLVSICQIKAMEKKFGAHKPKIIYLNIKRYSVRSILSLGGLRSFLKLKFILKKGDYDVVHSYMYISTIFLGLFKLLFPAIPFIAYQPSEKFSLGWGLFYFQSLFLFLFDKIIFLKYYQPEETGARFIPKSKFFPSVYGIKLSKDDEQVPPLSNGLIKTIKQAAPLILSASRLHPQRHLDVLIKGFAPVAMAKRTARLLQIGEGPEKERLQRLVSSLGVEDQVIFAGFYPQASYFYSNCHLYLTLTVNGVPGTAGQECMFKAKPVIGYEIGQKYSPYKEQDFYILPYIVLAFSPQGVTKAISYLLENPEEARLLGEEGKRFVSENLTVERTIEDLERLYASLKVR